MAVDERARHELHVKLEEVLGPEEASTLMAHLPPVGWGDVATKRDLDQLATINKREHDQLTGRLEERLGAEIRALRLEMQATRSDVLATLGREIHLEIRSLMIFMSSLFVALAGVAFAAARLT